MRRTNMIIPLSPEQFCVWSSCRPGSRPASNVPVAMRLVGQVDSAILTAALKDVVERHGILRTIFPEDEGVPRQEVLDECRAPELEMMSATESRMAQIIAAKVEYRFDLTGEIPVRAYLFSVNPVLHTLLMVFHPIAFDCGSISPLIRDLFAFYSGRIEKRKPDLQNLPMQYADYAGMRCLSPLPAVNSAARSGVEEFQNSSMKGSVPVRINPGLHRRVREFAEENGVSVASTLLAGFAIVCARLDAGDGVMLTVMDTVRDRLKDTVPMIGRFERMLPLEIGVRADPSFREVVRRAAEALSPERSTVGAVKKAATRFRTLFRLKSDGVERLELPMLKVYVNSPPMTETGFILVVDLTERLSPEGDPPAAALGIEGNVIFDSDILAPRRMLVQVDWMMNLLRRGMENPDVCINELPLQEKPTTWARAALAPQCRGTRPERVPITRVGTVHDSGRQERIPLTDSSHNPGVAVAPGWQQNYVAFQNAFECRMAGIWEEVLGISRVGVRDRFADLGGDADKARRIIRRVNRVFRKKLPGSLMCGGVTVEALCHAILKELPIEPVSAVWPGTGNGKQPLFFVHGDVFGGGLYTIELARHLGGDRPFFSLNPHGLDGQLMPESIEAMAEDYLRILRRMRPAGPIWLGGFCNGALIAYEMARMLEREGPRLQTPVLLVEPPPGDVSAASPAKSMSQPATRNPAPSGAQMQRAWVLSELFRLSARYRVGKYAGPVILVQPKKSLSDGVLIQSVWRGAADDLHIHIMPGDHITCIGRHVPELSEALRGTMETCIPL